MSSILSRYEADLRSAYGNFEVPRRHSVLQAVNRDPYAALRLELSAIGELEDDTDDNCDVCFTYFVRGDRLLIVKLSMVGRYAVGAGVRRRWFRLTQAGLAACCVIRISCTRCACGAWVLAGNRAPLRSALRARVIVEGRCLTSTRRC